MSEESYSVADSVDSDVDAMLDCDTADGKGEGEVPDPDFVSFATEGVEETDQED